MLINVVGLQLKMHFRAAEFVSSNYINSKKYQQNTPFKIRYNHISANQRHQIQQRRGMLMKSENICTDLHICMMQDRSSYWIFQFIANKKGP